MKNQKSKPILFSTPMVQAILEGRKTQTRRIIKSKHESGLFCVSQDPDGRVTSVDSLDWDEQPLEEVNDIQPLVKEGDILWVRETWSLRGWDPNEGSVSINYKAGKACDFYPDVDGIGDWVDKKADKLLAKGILEEDPDDEERLQFVDQKVFWEPSIFMPKWACRIFLEVTNVRVERLQDISEEDIISEGIFLDENDMPKKTKWTPELVMSRALQKEWKSLWQDINGKGSWNANPWVWVYDFKRVEQPKNF